MRRLSSDYVRALRRARSTPLSAWLRDRRQPLTTSGPITAGILPSDADYGMTADHVIDDPREPRVTPIGILDERGQMLYRVAIPIKVQMGFHIPNPTDEPDEVEAIVAEDMLSVSDCGMGLASVDPSEVDDEPTLEELLQAALDHCGGDMEAAAAMLAEHGLEVSFTATPVGDDAGDEE